MMYATAMAHCRVGTVLFFFLLFFLPKGQDLVSCIPNVDVYEVPILGLFFFQSCSIYRYREFVRIQKPFKRVKWV